MKIVIFIKNLFAFLILESIIIFSLKKSKSFQENLTFINKEINAALFSSKKNNFL